MELADRLRAAVAGRYDVQRALGHGGMAYVFLAWDVKLERQVAIKVLRPELSATLHVDRFLQEIQIAAGLQHPHILAVYDSGRADELLYYVMPYVEGESLRDRLVRETQLPFAEAVRIAREVAQALGYAHAHGIVHRDIKPENILLSDGHALVADFGIARATSAAGGERFTSAGMALGTPQYMSPEQGTGSTQLDGRTDIYALGCVLYEMLAGDPPFTGATATAIIAKHVSEPPPSLRIIRPAVPAALERSVERALAKVPADRFATAGSLAEAVSDSLQKHGVRDVRPSFAVRAAVAVVFLAVATLILALVLQKFGSREPGERRWVFVADFDSPSTDPTLGGAIRELVTVELNQSRFFSTMPRERLRAAMRNAGLEDSAPVPAALARELAFRSSAPVMVVGTVSRPVPDRYAIVVRAVSVRDGSDLVSASGAASEETLIAMVQRLARRVREGLGERRGEIEADKPLPQVTTPSFAAYRKLVDAVDLMRQGDIEGSNRLLGEAVVLDTGFAAAWGMMGLNHVFGRNLDSAQIALREALKRPERLTDAQRYWLEANAAYALRHDLPAAIRWYDLYLLLTPGSVSARNNRGLYLSSLGRYEDALREFERAVAANPFGHHDVQIELLNQTAVLTVLGKVAEAKETATRLTGPFASYAEILLASAAGDWVAAESLSLAAADAPTAPSWLRIQAVTTAASALAARGAVTSAQEFLGRAETTGWSAVDRWYHRARHLLSVTSGTPVHEHPAPGERDAGAAELLGHALSAVLAGDTVTAVANLGRLQEADSLELVQLGYGPAYLAAWLAARRGRWRETVHLMGEPALRGEHDATKLDRVGSLEMRWLVARAYEELGVADSAIGYFELTLEPLRIPPSHMALRGMVYPFAHRRLAALHLAIGHQSAAERHWRLFVQAFANPDSALRSLLERPLREGRSRGADMRYSDSVYRPDPASTTADKAVMRSPQR